MGKDIAVRTVFAGKWGWNMRGTSGVISHLFSNREGNLIPVGQVTVLCPAAPARGHHHPPASSPLHTFDAG